MKSLIDINIEKSRSGVYKDNPENRRLHRVGQRYGSPAREEDLASKPLTRRNAESKKPSEVKNEGVSNRNESSDKELRARELARVRAMTNDELAAEYLGYDADRYKKADKDYKEARSSFVKKWGDGLEGMISHISSMKDIEKLLKDSAALYEKQQLMFDSSPFTSKTLAALRTRITNAAKKGKDIKNLSVTMAVEPERGFWKDEDFLAAIGKNFASNLIKDTKYTNNAKMGNTLFWTESGLKYGNKLELSDEEHNKLASIIAGEQGDPENYNERRKTKIGGYEDFKNVVEGLGSGKKQNVPDTGAKKGTENRNGIGEIKGVKTVSREMPEPPEPFVYSDNGSMDLEKQGKNGFSVWVGFQHSERGRQPVNEAKMDRFARTTAVQQFLDTINDKYGTNFQPKDVEVENKWKNTDFFRLFLPVSSASEISSEPKKFSRVNLPDIPNAHKVNLTKYLSAKRKKAVDDAWEKAKFDSLPRGKAGVFQEGYNKLREQFNNNFDNMSKSERAELLYKILKMKNAMERK